MEVGGTGAVNPGLLIQVLQASQQAQVEMAENLVEVSAQMELAADQMAMIGTVLDIVA